MDEKRVPTPHLDQILDYLRQPVDAASLPPRQEHALRNDLFNTLRAQETPVPDLTEHLLNIRHDPAQDEVMRDYALQHMASYHDIASIFEKSLIEEELVITITNLSSPLAGTAMHGLNRINPVSEEIPDLLEKAVYQALSESSTHQLSRTTALQISGQRKYPFARDIAINHIRSPDISPNLKIVAIYALGEVGQFSDLAYLQGLSSQHYFRNAVQKAYLSISQ